MGSETPRSRGLDNTIIVAIITGVFTLIVAIVGGIVTLIQNDKLPWPGGSSSATVTPVATVAQITPAPTLPSPIPSVPTPLTPAPPAGFAAPTVQLSAPRITLTWPNGLPTSNPRQILGTLSFANAPPEGAITCNFESDALEKGVGELVRMNTFVNILSPARTANFAITGFPSQSPISKNATVTLTIRCDNRAPASVQFQVVATP